ncbi:MAG: AtpZ/AtpI family protein [Aggregatilineales bacterium]
MSVPPDLRPDGQEPRPVSERELRQRQLVEDIARKERRKLRHRRHGGGIWFGLGTFGIVGWSIALPTLIGIAVALWANSIRPGTWTLGFFFLGLAIGLFNAWQWVAKEQRAMEREREERDRDE